MTESTIQQIEILRDSANDDFERRLFGAILAWAVYDRITLKRRADPGAPPIPVRGTRNDVIAVVIGTLLYLALGFVFHPLVIGLPAFGTPAFGR